MKQKVYLLLFMVASSYPVYAQIDPTLSAMIFIYTEKAEDELKSQEMAMMM